MSVGSLNEPIENGLSHLVLLYPNTSQRSSYKLFKLIFKNYKFKNSFHFSIYNIKIKNVLIKVALRYIMY